MTSLIKEDPITGSTARRPQGGFTLIELLVTLGLLSVVSVGFYQVLFSSTRAVDTAQNAIAVSEEARLGFNRLVRDTRESERIVGPTATSFTVEIDFDASGAIEASPAAGPALGNFERLTFTFNPAGAGNGTITVAGGGLSEVLMRGVDCVRKPDNSCHDVFTYASSRLEYDTSGDGRSSAAEIQAALDTSPDGLLDSVPELGAIDVVEFALTMQVGEATETFYSEAQLRNQR